MNQTVDFVNASDFFEAIELGGAESVPRPRGRRAANEAYVDDSQRHEGPVHMGCDLNMQVQRPRNDDAQDV